ncbi:MAG TPA: 7-carboxy-7-deazaguanine synthase QueE [Candidatus Krumholzibacteria bacterium]|nr:7-carboxy-7-deazaguanine synthase QueE [Candidatus Krumholzibacteria bacterium]
MENRAANGAGVLTGYLSEMFCSVQGEGLFVGERQVFVRTAGCVATCSWCDTVYSKVRTPRFVTHTDDGADKRWRSNPVALVDVVADVVAFASSRGVRDVSLTGGEPLEQAAFCAALAHQLDAAGLRIHLETAGLHARELTEVIASVRVIAMDVKLPSATGMEHWDAHRDFLAVMKAHPDERRTDFVKVVVDLNGTTDEIEHAALLVAACDRRVPLIIQPESGALFGKGATPAAARELLDLIDAGARAAAAHLDTVRVIPQTHKALNIR